MATLSQKCYYSLRALFELALRHRQGPVRIGDVAKAQAIPPRFLEVILNELKQGGFVESRRGKDGGYFLVREPATLTLGEVIRFVDGPFAPVDCIQEGANGAALPAASPAGATALAASCPMGRACAFEGVWRRVHAAVADIYDGTTFGQLVEDERARRGRYVPDFVI